ncbi:GNAT family acetyltransferase [Roseibium sp. MMSF_3412]|uniref:GNAT family acetyltransferase n=1 Tax=Roseibium sp. MMSF_3412 TaxID=3046712 RepID=UPI0027402976|nr:GNAT family acetyltransferase [Roseibium sp. MMSF_3412]
MSEQAEPVIAPFEEGHRKEVISLWQSCGLTRAWNDPDKDIDRKLSDPQGGFFVLLQADKVIGSVMAGYDGHRGAIYYLSIDPEHQSSGLGRLLMEHCEEFLIGLGCPKINLFVRQGNEAVMKFYDGLGYAPEKAVALGKRLIPDD